MIRKFDFLAIGSGVAGMSYTLQVAESGQGRVALVCKANIEEANTAKAQGGVASVTNFEVDNFKKHITDTLIASNLSVLYAQTTAIADGILPACGIGLLSFRTPIPHKILLSQRITFINPPEFPLLLLSKSPSSQLFKENHYHKDKDR